MAFRSQNQFCLEIQPVSLHFSYSSSWSEAQTLSTICLPWVLSVIQLWQNNAQWKLICSEAGRADVLWRHACNQFALVLSVPGTRVLLPSTLAPHGLWAVPEWNNYCFSKRKIKHSYRDIFLHSVWAHTMPSVLCQDWLLHLEQSPTLFKKSRVPKYLCMLYALKSSRQYHNTWYLVVCNISSTQNGEKQTTQAKKPLCLRASIGAASLLWRSLDRKCVSTSQSQPIHLQERSLFGA